MVGIQLTMEYLYNRNWMENLIVTILPKHTEADFLEYIVRSPKTGMKIVFIRKEGKKMSIMSQIKRWNWKRKQMNQLNQLSNRELEDLGLSRSQLPWLVEREASRVFDKE